MILRALYDFYNRLRSSGDSTIAPLGFSLKEIHFLVVIDPEGHFVRIEDRRIDKKLAQQFFVVSDSRSSAIKPYAMYDNMEYVLGYAGTDKDGKSKEEKALPKHRAFVDRCRELAQKYPNCEVFSAIVKFYDSNEKENLKESPLWSALTSKAGAWISFLLQGESIIAASRPELENETGMKDSGIGLSDNFPCCLITGEKTVPVVTTTPTMIPGGNSASKLVSFQVNSGYDSYGKKQCGNSPISQEAEYAYSNALLYLLDKKSRNKFLLGNRTFVFWTSSMSEQAQAIEDGLNWLMGSSANDESLDDGQSRIDQVRKAFESIYSGILKGDEEDKFFILGMAPNKGRISVVYWNETTVKNFASKILRHFDDMDIIRRANDSNTFMGLRSMLATTTISGSAKDASPNLPESVIKSIFEGVAYPQPLFSAVIRRIRASNQISLTRAAIIKAYLNRNHSTTDKLITTMLDPSNTNLGYVCGRLFAVIEYTQMKANGIKSVKERYLNAASATPAAVFPTLLNLSVHHVEKIDNPNTRIFIEKLKQDIIDLLPSAGFPSHLSIQDQGRFFVGYYHQTQDLFTPKNSQKLND